jgi:membrane-bound lytic murein transglycosylase B
MDMRIRAPFFALSICAVLLALPAYADTTGNQRAALQAQLDQINQEIKQNQTQLSLEQQQRTSLERDVAILNSKIQEAQLEIKQRTLTIQQLKDGIAEKEQGIQGLDTQVAAGEASLAQILRETSQIDNTSLAEIALNGTLTDMFKEIDDFHIIQQALGTSFTTMAAQRSDLSARKDALVQQQQEAQDLLQIQKLQQNTLKTTEQQKQNLVTAARGQESIYLQVIANKQKTAAQIQSALFALNGASHTTSFGDMYSYAKEASALTNVRPAVILGILREESDLGQNVGTGNWMTDMSPANQPAFTQITSGLGLDPNAMPVSKKPCYGNPCSGWGGAMGPAQFIPTTWQLYSDRIAQAAGQTPPNPWDPRTATFATALLMMDNGADAQTPSAERLAALRYLAGWKNAGNAAYAFYGNAVMSYAAEYQSDIDVLASGGSTGS